MNECLPVKPGTRQESWSAPATSTQHYWICSKEPRKGRKSSRHIGRSKNVLGSGQVAQLVRASSHYAKVVGSVPGQGTCRKQAMDV